VPIGHAFARPSDPQRESTASIATCFRRFAELPSFESSERRILLFGGESLEKRESQAMFVASAFSLSLFFSREENDATLRPTLRRSLRRGRPETTPPVISMVGKAEKPSAERAALENERQTGEARSAKPRFAAELVARQLLARL